MSILHSLSFFRGRDPSRSACSQSSRKFRPSCAPPSMRRPPLLGYDLWQLSQAGPADDLNATERTQPAMLAAGIATWRLWRERGGAQPAVRHRAQPRRVHGTGRRRCDGFHRVCRARALSRPRDAGSRTGGHRRDGRLVRARGCGCRSGVRGSGGRRRRRRSGELQFTGPGRHRGRHARRCCARSRSRRRAARSAPWNCRSAYLPTAAS